MTQVRRGRLSQRKLRWPLLACTALASSWVSCAKTEPTDTPAPAIRLTYQPFAAAFVGTTHRTVEQEFDGQVVTNESALQLFLHVEVVPVGDLQTASFTLDSVVQLEGPNVDMMTAEYGSARGVTFTGVLAANGELSNWTGYDSVGTAVGHLADQFLRSFFPRIPDAGFLEAQSWADSVETTTLVGGAETMLRAQRSHDAVGWTEFLGNRAFEIASQSRYTFSGTGVQVGQSFTITGRGRRHSRHYISAGGHLLGSVSTDTSDAEAEITAAGIVVPVRQVGSDSLIKMP